MTMQVTSDGMESRIHSRLAERVRCAPAPFFSEEFELTPGASVSFSYAVVVADGAAGHDRMSSLADRGRAALDAR